MKIASITPQIIIDSRREKTIEVFLSAGEFGSKASVPCGKSKGEFEAFCHTAEKGADLIKEIAAKILAEEFADQKSFDEFLISLDGTENKNNLGANVTLSLSIAFSRLLSDVEGKPLFKLISDMVGTSSDKFPLLFSNLINGGLHVNPSLCPLPFQEYLLIPKTDSPKESLGLVTKFLELLKAHLSKTATEIHYGDEGGLILSGEDPDTGFKTFQEIVEANKDSFSDKIYFGLDVASSSLWRSASSDYGWDNGVTKCEWTNQELERIYKNLTEKYSLLSIEDPFQQEAWEDWKDLNKEIGDKIWLIGDDLTVTNVKRIQKAKEMKAVNAVLIKPDQIGTVSESIDALLKAREFGWKVIVSHRSGETNDTFIADLAYGAGADGLKAGSPTQTERLAKYNRLIEIEASTLKASVE